MEEWRDVPGYEGYYQVSSVGNVRSLDRIIPDGRKIKGKVLTPYSDRDGYLHITLKINGTGKHFLIHRLVAEAYIPNPFDLPQINHKDENRLNNCCDNLEWCDAKYNVNYGNRAKKYAESYHGEMKYNSKLTDDDVLFIRKHYKSGDSIYGQSALARKYNVDRMTVKYAATGRTWKHLLKEVNTV